MANRVISDSAEYVVKRVIQNIPDESKNADWFLTITGGFAALLFSNYETFENLFHNYYIALIVLFLFLSFLTGLWGRSWYKDTKAFFDLLVLRDEFNSYGKNSADLLLEEYANEENIGEKVASDFTQEIEKYVPFFLVKKIRGECKKNDTLKSQSLSKRFFWGEKLISLQKLFFAFSLLVVLVAVVHRAFI